MGGGKGALSEAEVKGILQERSIHTTHFLVPHRQDLGSLPLSFPVAVKASSPTILHKTEVGGLYLDVRSHEDLVRKYDDLRSRFPGAEILVEPMEAEGPEVIVGLARDRDFGMSIMLGMGGVMAELYKDASFRKLPISRMDAEEMLGETRASAFFEGFRGFRADKVAMLDLLEKVSLLGQEYDGLEQLDLNPVILRETGYVVVDAKMVLRGD
jgi:hypothetical protein